MGGEARTRRARQVRVDGRAQITENEKAGKEGREREERRGRGGRTRWKNDTRAHVSVRVRQASRRVLQTSGLKQTSVQTCLSPSISFQRELTNAATQLSRTEPPPPALHAARAIGTIAYSPARSAYLPSRQGSYIHSSLALINGITLACIRKFRIELLSLCRG